MDLIKDRLFLATKPIKYIIKLEVLSVTVTGKKLLTWHISPPSSAIENREIVQKHLPHKMRK